MISSTPIVSAPTPACVIMLSSAGLTKEAPPLESAQESPAGYTISIKGVLSLPTTAGEGSGCVSEAVSQFNLRDDSPGGLSWEQRNSVVETSVFGQLAKQLSRRCENERSSRVRGGFPLLVLLSAVVWADKSRSTQHPPFVEKLHA